MVVPQSLHDRLKSLRVGCWEPRVKTFHELVYGEHLLECNQVRNEHLKHLVHCGGAKQPLAVQRRSKMNDRIRRFEGRLASLGFE